MRNIKKISLAVLLVLTMLVQMVPAFAYVSPIVYEYGEDGSVTSYVYARDLKNGAVLYTAIYDANGDFVSAVKSPVANKAGYLKTIVTPAEGQTIKSFIWDKSLNPFAADGEYTDSINLDDATITVNNIDLKEFIAEDAVIADGASFDLDVLECGFTATPMVRASSKDSQVECTVEYIKDNATAVVTFTKGERLLSDDSITATNKNGVSLLSERYEKPYKATVTINFVRNFLSDMDLVPGSPCGAILNTNSCDYHFKKDYSLETGATVKQINLGFASLPNQSTVVIVEPKDKSADKMAIVKADGSAPSWENDTQVVKEFNYDTYKPVSYNQKSTAVVTATNQVPWVCRELLFGDDGCETSSRYLTDRNPTAGGYNIWGMDGSKTSALAQALEGCNYIIYASGDKTNVTTSFYVGEDVTVHVFSNNAAVKPADVVDAAFVNWADSCKGTSKLNKRYQNSIDAISVAWLIREGVITEADVSYQKNQNAWYDTNGDGKRQYGDATTNEGLSYLLNSNRVPAGYITGDCMSAYYTRRYDAIDYLVRESGNLAGWGFDSHNVKKDIPNSILPKYYSETYKYTDYLAMWTDWTYSADRAPLVVDYVHETAVNVVDMPMAKGTETATYTGVVSVPAGVHFKPISLFADTITPDRNGLELDANGILKNVNGTGALRQYPDGFGLEDATFFCFTNGPANDAGYLYGSAGYYDQVPPKGSYHDMWVVRGTCYPWYSFKVSRDADILVFSSGDLKFLEEDANYDKAVLESSDDWFKIYRNMNNNPVNYYSLNKVYSTTAKAGSTIEMKTPGTGEVLYCVFVKEAKNPEINTKLSSISVDGVEIEGFDPEVKEYSVEIADPSVLTAPVVTAVAEDALATVEVVPATEFPGSTKVIVNHVNGGTEIYTVNHTYDSALLANLNVMDGTIPKTAFQWAIDAGKIKYTSENDYVLSANSNDRPLYFKGGMVPGTRCFNARSYTIDQVKDASIYGKDVIVPSYSWIDSTMNASTAAFSGAGQANPVVIENWVNFDIARKAVVKIFVTNGTTYLQNKLEGQGYTKATDKNYYFVDKLNQNASTGVWNYRNFNVMYSKTFEAGKVNIPNGYNANDFYTIVIDYVDYE